MGKLDTAEMATFDQAVLATQQAANDLGLHFKPYPASPGKNASLMALPFVDEKGSAVKVLIERRAERLVLIRIDVGLFGSEVVAHLILTRLRAHLPQPPGGGKRSSEEPTSITLDSESANNPRGRGRKNLIKEISPFPSPI